MRSFTLVAGLVALFTSQSNAQSPTLPSQDPFYSQPANISAYKPGDVIRLRPIPPTLQGPLPALNFSVKSATQLLYRTTDSLGASVAAVATFLVPNGSNANSSSLLAYSAAYDSANNNCSPSYSLRPGANNSIGLDATVIEAALSNGWYVVTSDYEGLQAEFIAGIQSGHGVLDSIRASFNRSAIVATGLSPTAHYAMFGYSGGALASEWAAELAPAYAPDLNRFVGTAIGGLTPNVTNVLLTINNQSTVGLAFAGSLGLGKAYANLSSYINQNLVPSKRAQYFNISNGCPSQYGNEAANMNFFSYFTTGMGLIFSDVWKTVSSGAGQMGVHGFPKQPLYVYKGALDEISPIVDTDLLINKYCSNGLTIEYTRDLATDHGLEALVGTPAAFAWLQDRFAGRPLSQQNNLNNCEIRNVTLVEIDMSAAAAAYNSDSLAKEWKNDQDKNVTFDGF